MTHFNAFSLSCLTGRQKRTYAVVISLAVIVVVLALLVLLGLMLSKFLSFCILLKMFEEFQFLSGCPHTVCRFLTGKRCGSDKKVKVHFCLCSC